MNARDTIKLSTLFGSFQLVDKTRIHLAWPAAHNVKSETLFEVIKHLMYGTVYYINIFTNLSLLRVEMYLLSKLFCESRHLAWAYCLCQSCSSCTRCHKKSVGLLMISCTICLSETYRKHIGNISETYQKHRAHVVHISETCHVLPSFELVFGRINI
jgi:hypothetical protein